MDSLRWPKKHFPEKRDRYLSIFTGKSLTISSQFPQLIYRLFSGFSYRYLSGIFYGFSNS